MKKARKQVKSDEELQSDRFTIRFTSLTAQCLRKAIGVGNISSFLEELAKLHPAMIRARHQLGFTEWQERRKFHRPKTKR